MRAVYIADVLAKLGRDAERAIPTLIAALDRTPGVSWGHYINKLAAFGRAAVPPLVAALESGSEGVRMGAVYTLEVIGPAAAEAVPALIRCLKNKESSDTRSFAAGALGECGWGSEAALAALRGAMGDADRNLAAEAADAYYGLTGDSEAVMPALIRALGTSSNVLLTLAEIGPRARGAVPAILEVRDRDGVLTGSALIALTAIGPELAVPGIRQALGGRHELIRACAARALAGLGREAEPAVPELIAMLESDEVT